MSLQKNTTTLVIADDHPMLLKGLYEELVEHGYKVVARCDNGMKALGAIIQYRPSIALLDIDMPLLTGFDVIKMARDKGVETKFIVLSFHKEPEYIVQAKTLQIDGYLLKEDSFFEIEKCIETVLQGKECFSKSFQNKALENADSELNKISLLTPSEKTILKMIANDIDSHDIAEQLSVSIRTVEKHRSNIISKLELPAGTNSLMKWALTNKNIILEL